MPAHPLTTVRSETSWNVEIAGRRFAITRVRERQTSGWREPVGYLARGSFRSLATGALVGLGAFGLFVAGAVASQYKAASPHYLLQLPVPTASRVRAVVPPGRRHRTAGEAAAAPVDPPSTGERNVDAAYRAHLAQALQTGEFQEWTGPDGRRRFLTVGTGYAMAGRRCHDLALLVRDAGGGDQVSTVRRCTGEAAEAVEPAQAEAPDGGTATPVDQPS